MKIVMFVENANGGAANTHRTGVGGDSDLYALGVVLFTIALAAIILGFLFPWLIFIGVTLLICSLVAMIVVERLHSRIEK